MYIYFHYMDIGLFGIWQYYFFFFNNLLKVYMNVIWILCI